MKSAEDCHPISGFSHRWPLDNTSQSIRQWCPCHSPDCVAVLDGRKILVTVESAGECPLRVHIQPSVPYRTVLACSSTGAPESTAAATLSPGSLPSITRFGTGENGLQIRQPISLPDRVGTFCPYEVPWSIGASKSGRCFTVPSEAPSCRTNPEGPCGAAEFSDVSALGSGCPGEVALALLNRVHCGGQDLPAG